MSHYVIHIGVRENDIPILWEIFGERNVTIDGDGWNEWGEKRGTYSNKDADVYHAVIGPFGGLLFSEVTAEYLADYGSGITVAMTEPEYQEGITVSLTDADDWGEEVNHWYRPAINNE